MSLLPKPAGCAECPLRDVGKGFCPDKVAPRAKYLFIGEAPGKNEIIESKERPAQPFVGQAGFVLRDWLLRAVPALKMADERGEITYANTLRCLPPEIQKRAYPKGEDKAVAERVCRQYDHFTEGIETVVLFGESPQRCFFGEELHAEDVTDRKLQHDVKGVSGRMGRVYEQDGKRWVFAPHPAWILRQPSIVEHGQAALRIAANQEKVVHVKYTGWDDAMGVLC